MKTTKLVKKLDCKRDDVVYTIYVEADGGTMWGTWGCHDCGTGGASQTKCTTMDAAIRAAQDDLERHHMVNHTITK